jgi:glycine betaine/proline transport system ATP-binding protein
MDSQSKPKIRCESVWKVFGDNCEQIIRNWDAYKGMDKVQRLKETGCVVGTREASFVVQEGEIYCIMGLSGSGKSTLLRCINRLHEPNRGRITIGDEEVTSLRRDQLRQLRRKKTGMVFQHFALLPHRRLLTNVALGLEIQGEAKSKREARAHEMLELVGLKGWEKSYPYELSGGMQQRVGLARALAPDPEILLMDEAFSALDPLIRRQMQDEFVKLIKKVKKTIVFVTHDLHEALRIANHIAVMKDGEIVQQGTPADIVLNPEKGYVEDFVRDLPKTKFITAHDIMEPPDRWLLKSGETTAGIIEHMNRENLRFAFLMDENGRVLDAIDFFRVSRVSDSIELDRPPSPERCSTDFPVCFANPDDFLEDLLDLGVKSKVPTVIRDPDHRVIGIVPREALLHSLTSSRHR